MAKISLGLGSKVTALLISSVVLSGCYKIEMRETLNLDGTSEIALKIDMSGMATAMSGMNMEMASDLSEADALVEEPTGPTYESCSDPELIEKYGAESLEGPEKIESVIEAEKITTCAPSETEGMVTITVENIDTDTNENLFGQTIERRGDSCEAPALLAFYQIDSFEDPLVEPFSINRTLDISCSDIRNDIQVTTITAYEGQPTPGPVIESFEKSVPEIIPTDTLAELEALTLSPKEIEAKEMSESINVCDETQTAPEDLPFFFTKCENTDPGVGVFYYTKYDTTGFKINQNGTVTYNLEPSTESFNETVNEELEDNNDQSMSSDIDPAMFGFAVDYVLVSPWPILEYSAGELEDEYTLRVNLLQETELETLTVTLDTNGSTLDMLAPRTQLQIDQLIDSLEEQLRASDAPTERQIEYIYHLSSKIQRLAAMRPAQQVPLGYLQTKLITLATVLEAGPIQDLEAEFMEALQELEAEAFADEEAVFEEAETQMNLEAEAQVSSTETEDNNNNFPPIVEETTMPDEDLFQEEEEILIEEEEAAELEEALNAANETLPPESETPPSIEEEVFEDEESFEEEESFEDEEEFFEDEEEIFDEQASDQAIVLE